MLCAPIIPIPVYTMYNVPGAAVRCMLGCRAHVFIDLYGNHKCARSHLLDHRYYDVGEGGGAPLL